MTAYEMRISDWSSDVCSSDFNAAIIAGAWVVTQLAALRAEAVMVGSATAQGGAWAGLAVTAQTSAARIAGADRKSGGWGKRGSVRGELGRRRILKNKKTNRVESHNLYRT